MSSDTAAQRLAASRAAIDAELRKLQGDGDEGDTAPAQPGQASAGTSTSAPWFGTVSRDVRLWWRRHPARPVLEMASDAGALVFKPVVRKHPLAALSMALVAGAALVALRPWRSRVTAVVWAALSAQLTAGLVRSVLNPATLMTLLGNVSLRSASKIDESVPTVGPPHGSPPPRP